MIKRKGLIALTVITVLMFGCTKKIWTNPNVTSNEQAQKEFADCKYDAVKNTASFMGLGDSLEVGIASEMRKNEIVSTCMARKGYGLTDANKLEESKKKTDECQRQILNSEKPKEAKQRLEDKYNSRDQALVAKHKELTALKGKLWNASTEAERNNLKNELDIKTELLTQEKNQFSEDFKKDREVELKKFTDSCANS